MTPPLSLLIRIITLAAARGAAAAAAAETLPFLAHKGGNRFHFRFGLLLAFGLFVGSVADGRRRLGTVGNAGRSVAAAGNGRRRGR